MKGVNKYVSELVSSIGKTMHCKEVKAELSTKMRQSVFIVVAEDKIRFNKKWVIETSKNDKKELNIIINYAVYRAKVDCHYTAYSLEEIKKEM